MIYQQLKEANVAALKNHDANARAILSVLLNKIKLVEIEKRTANADLTDADVVAVLQKTLKELDEEKQAFERAGRTENVQALNAQIAFVSAYLPKMMTDEEIKAKILALPRQVGAFGDEALQGKLRRQVRICAACRKCSKACKQLKTKTVTLRDNRFLLQKKHIPFAF